MRFQSYFYPRSPCGERQAEQPLPTATIAISIHALLAESDNAANDDEQNTFVFLSTLSLRRATQAVPAATPRAGHFYPRSPCGERPAFRFPGLHTITNFYPRSPCGERRTKTALTSTVLNFYPRSPCGERPMTSIYFHGIFYFYPRSPCGERHLPQRNCAAGAKFLSTLSLRRATITLKEYAFRHGNFYPRSPCGERRFSFWRCTAQRIFLSTLSLRRATLPGGDRPRHAGISIHALLAESDMSHLWKLCEP